MSYQRDEEQKFLENYNMRDYDPVAVTVDLTIFTIRNGQLSILLIQRGDHPFKGCWALPGGFVNQKETLEEAAIRELEEETGISIDSSWIEQLRTYGGPNRDPRGYVVSTAYVALQPNLPQPTGGDDAAEAKFFPVEEILNGKQHLAFDHEEIIKDAIERIRAKLEYAPIAFSFLQGDEFTLSELRNVYETIWGTDLVASNFRRKVMNVPGLVEPLGRSRTSDVEGGRKAMLFKQGEAREIHPKITMP